MGARPRPWHTGDHRRCCHIRTRPACRLPELGSLVRRAQQTLVQSAELDLRPGLDDALCADGICGVAHLATTGASAARGLALTLFFIQLALNAAWSWMFFGANNPLLGVINIVPQFLIFWPLSSRSIGSIGWLRGASCRSQCGLVLRVFSILQSGG